MISYLSISISSSLPDYGWEHWNVLLFNHIHATGSSPHLLIAAAAWLAELPLYLAILYSAWKLVSLRDTGLAIRLLIACVCAILIEHLVSTHAYHPRPFAAGYGPAWVFHDANNSMPSTHATLAWTLAAGFALRKHFRSSAVLLLLGGVMAWARIYVGIHWPADMAGAALSAALSTAVGYGAHAMFARLPVLHDKKIR